MGGQDSVGYRQFFRIARAAVSLATAMCALAIAVAAQTNGRTSVDPSRGNANVDLSGTWSGKGYNCPDNPPQQIVRIRVTGTSVVATKLLGDDCVVAGEITWTGTLTGSTTIPIRFHLRDPKTRSEQWSDMTLDVRSPNELHVTGLPIVFYRFPCNDPTLPLNDDYDKADPKHHFYQRIGFICWSWETRCTIDAVFDVMSRTASAFAPTSPAVQAVSNCATLKVRSARVHLFGRDYGKDNRVRIVIDRQSRSITNFTAKGHIFYPGQIRRTVVYTNDISECARKMPIRLHITSRDFSSAYCVMVLTTGEGVGDYGWENKELGKWVIFADADDTLRDTLMNEARVPVPPESASTPP